MYTDLSFGYNLEHGPMMVRRIRCNGTEKKLSDCVVIFIDYEKKDQVCYAGARSLRCVDG